MPFLIVTTEQGRGNYYKLGSRTMTGGRDPANAIQITDGQVSRKHFQIRNEGGLYLITDLKSHNGVHVNGQKVGEALLADGDQIQVGGTTMVYTTNEITDRTDAINYYKEVSRRNRDQATIMRSPESA